MSDKNQLECRIVIIYHHPRRIALVEDDRLKRWVEVGMFDPLNLRYQFIGRHRPDELDKVVGNLKRSIEGAGHRLTFCERSEY